MVTAEPTTYSAVALFEAYAAHLRKTRGKRARHTLDPIEEHWLSCFAELDDMRLFTVEMFDGWLRAQLEAESDRLATMTIAKHRGNVSGMLRWAQEHLRCIEANPARLSTVRFKARVRDPKRRKLEALTPQQVTRWCANPAIPFHLQWLGEVAIFTGTRIGEAMAFTRRHIEQGDPYPGILIAESWDSKAHELGPTKADEPRRVPLVHLLERLERVDAWFAQTFGRTPTPDDPLCPYPRIVHACNPVRDYLEPGRWCHSTALNNWHAWLERIGIRHPAAGPRSLHCTRHTFITWLRRLKVPFEVSWDLTHSAKPTNDALLDYDHLFDDWQEKCEAVAKLRLCQKTKREVERGFSQLELL